MSLSKDIEQFTQSPFSNQLIQSGYINLPRMQQAFIEARNSGRPLMTVLEEITGQSLPPELVRHYKERNRFTLKILHGIDFIDLETESVDPETMAKLIDAMIPIELCRRYQLLPINQIETSSQMGVSLRVAMVNPSDINAQNKITQALGQNISWQRVGITQEDYNELSSEIMEQYTHQPSNQQKVIKEKPLKALNNLPEMSSEATLVDATEVYEQPSVMFSEDSTAAPIVVLVNKILNKAIEKQAIQLEIEPHEQQCIIRYRQKSEETLKPLFDPLPKKVAAPILSRLKIMAQLDISQQQKPQKGRICQRGGDRSLYFLVNILPSMSGEKASIRILDSSIKPPNLQTLIPQESIRKLIEDLMSYQSGLIVIGNSGQFETFNLLYSLLSYKKKEQLSIATVEQLMGHLLEGITQLEIDPKGDKGYGSVLRSLSTQDLDIVMVDQVRDTTTARMVVEMSRNHLMLTSFQANDGATALADLSQMVDNSLLADTLVAVIHPHSLPRLCPTCQFVYDPNAAELAKFGLAPATKEQLTFYQPRILNDEAIKQAQERGRLCRQCHGKGYSGQLEVYEIIQGTPSVKIAITQKADRQVFKQAAKQDGLLSPLTTALEFVEQGQASLKDIAQIFAEDLAQISQTNNHDQLSMNLTERVENFQKLLISLTQEFQGLKQAIESTVPSLNDSDPTITPADEVLTQVQNWEHLKHEIDPSKETISADSHLYEELTDPGDWDLLRQELHADKETIAADFSDSQQLDTDGEFNPFQRMPDPWS